AQKAAFEAAASLPGLDALGDTLSGWQEQLAAYGMAVRSDAVADADSEASGQEIAQTFAALTSAAPAAPAPGESDAGAAAGASSAAPGALKPHATFHKCPVIEVSNAGPVNAERALVEYTPWVDTPAGVLIRAPI